MSPSFRAKRGTAGPDLERMKGKANLLDTLPNLEDHRFEDWV
jgi:hypothetical protein